MTAVQLDAAVLEQLVVSVASELQSVASCDDELTGSEVASAIKTVAVLDFKLRVAELPEALLGMFSDAKLNNDNTFKLGAVIQRIVA